VNPAAALQEQFLAIGYGQPLLRADYRYSDVLSEDAPELTVKLAAFTSSPPSYRTAAFGVVECADPANSHHALRHRALGAPVIFLASDQDICVWRYDSSGTVSNVARLNLNGLPTFFAEQAAMWGPEAVHRAKLGLKRREAQLSLLGANQLLDISLQTRLKLDKILERVAEEISGLGNIDIKLFFQAAFRLFAAKILIDRNHPAAQGWANLDTKAIVENISGYYGLKENHLWWAKAQSGKLDAAWSIFNGSFNFQNISADDLAFVYENTLVTSQTRAQFSTHSTPRVVAEHVVSLIDFDNFGETSTVYEPFCGAGSFLLAAMERLRQKLPIDISDADRHKHFVSRLHGDDLDSLAVEVAKLSLILGDWPNQNGWDIGNIDLFSGKSLQERMLGKSIILCNPPFEQFTNPEREKYPEISGASVHKAVAVLGAAIDAKPDALGFVLPRSCLQEKQYDELRRKLEGAFETINTVSLPDKIFKAATFESALIVAQGKRKDPTLRQTYLVSEVVSDQERERYLLSGTVSTRRSLTKLDHSAKGDIWVKQLDEIWEYLADYPKLGSIIEAHRGLEWNSDQSAAYSTRRREGFQRGLATIRGSLVQYEVTRSGYLDCRPENLRTNAISYNWGQPKIIASAIRRSRGAWRIAAAIDSTGLICSQQFFGIWASKPALPAICSLLNSPLANAYLQDHSTGKGIRIETLRGLPIPYALSCLDVEKDITAYRNKLAGQVLRTHESEHDLNMALKALDEIALKAYNLPHRLKRLLLEAMAGQDDKRPVAHHFSLHLPMKTMEEQELETSFAQLYGSWPPAKVERLKRRIEMLSVPDEADPDDVVPGPGPIARFLEFLTAIGNVAYPDVSATPNGGVFASWASPLKRLAAEFSEDGNIQFVVCCTKNERIIATSEVKQGVTEAVQFAASILGEMR